jgi:hypothetical protein
VIVSPVTPIVTCNGRSTCNGQIHATTPHCGIVLATGIKALLCGLNS